MGADSHRVVLGPDRPGRSGQCARRGRYTRAHPGRVTVLAVSGCALFFVLAGIAQRLRLNPDDVNTRAFPDVGATLLAVAVTLCAEVLLLCAFALHDRAVVRGTYRVEDPGALVWPVLRPFCWLVILPSLAGVAVLASRVAGSDGPLRVDQRVDDRLVYRLSPLRPMFGRLVQLGSPTGVAVLCALLALGCLARRRVRAAILAAAGPSLAGLLTEYALKPLIGRHSGHLFAFPSGHTTGAVAVAVTITLFLLPAGPFAGLPRWSRLLLAGLAAVLASFLPLGLIVLRYHYASDVLAGAAVAVAVILALALLLDAVARRSTPPRSTRSQAGQAGLYDRPAVDAEDLPGDVTRRL